MGKGIKNGGTKEFEFLPPWMVPFPWLSWWSSFLCGFGFGGFIPVWAVVPSVLLDSGGRRIVQIGEG